MVGLGRVEVMSHTFERLHALIQVPRKRLANIVVIGAESGAGWCWNQAG